MSVQSIAAAISRRGQPLTLRRTTGTQKIPFDVELVGVVRGYTPQELVGDIQQGDREVIVSNSEIAARQWPGPPKQNDMLKIAGKWVNVQAVNTVYLGPDVAEHRMQVRG